MNQNMLILAVNITPAADFTQDETSSQHATNAVCSLADGRVQ